MGRVSRVRTGTIADLLKGDGLDSSASDVAIALQSLEEKLKAITVEIAELRGTHGASLSADEKQQLETLGIQIAKSRHFVSLRALAKRSDGSGSGNALADAKTRLIEKKRVMYGVLSGDIRLRDRRERDELVKEISKLEVAIEIADQRL